MSTTKEKSLVLFDKLEKEWSPRISQLDQISELQWNQAPIEGKWSIVQIFHHLLTAEKGSLLYIKKKSSFPDTLVDANFNSWKNALVIKTYLKVPIPFKAPPIVAEIPKDLQAKQVIKKWQASRKNLKEFINSTEENILEKQLYKHPIVGRMTMTGALSFFYEHQKRHNKQIVRAIKILKV